MHQFVETFWDQSNPRKFLNSQAFLKPISVTLLFPGHFSQNKMPDKTKKKIL